MQDLIDKDSFAGTSAAGLLMVGQRCTACVSWA